ncbi:hypothetical protein ACHAQD_002426 [Fusarium lateritium]
MKSWFLPPDFTFKPDGPLQLGAVIPHPSHPTQTLASPRTDPSIILPEIEVLIEKDHSHSNEVSRTAGVNLFAKFIEVASASIDHEANRRYALEYGTADHEVRSLAAPFTKGFLKSIVELEDVKNHIASGLFGNKTVYFVSGLRVTNASFTVTKEKGSGYKTSVSGSGPTGPVPVEIGGGLSSGRDKSKVDSYETAPGIIFAYRLHAIRVRGSGGLTTEMFSHRTAFYSERNEPDGIEAVEVTAEVLGDDMEEMETAPQYKEEDLGDGEYFLRAVE